MESIVCRECGGECIQVAEGMWRCQERSCKALWTEETDKDGNAVIVKGNNIGDYIVAY